MKRNVLLIVVCSILIIALSGGVHYILSLAGQSLVSVFAGREVVEPPESGKWKNETLNIVLDYDTGFGTLYLEDEEIICQISGEFNTSIFYFDVAFLSSNNNCSIKKGTLILYGHYRIVEEDRILIQEDETGKGYWFTRIKDGDETQTVPSS